MQNRHEVHLRPQVVRREQDRRRIVLLSIATLIVLGTSPVFGHHLASRAEVLLAGHDHLFNLCLIALHSLLAPVHGVFHLLLGGGVLYAIGSRVRAGWRSWQTLRALESFQPSNSHEPFATAIANARVSLSSVRVVRGLPVPAFTAGWLRPRIFLAARLADTLSTDELAMVLAHEGAHAARRDPLRLSLLRFLADTLFYLPAIRRLASDIADEAEISADDIAAGKARDGATMLASAIVKLADWTTVYPPATHALPQGVTGFYRPDLVERRVRRLIGEDVPVGTHVTARSLGAAAMTLALVMASGLIMAHPLAAGTLSPAAEELKPSDHKTAPGHCRHRGGMAITHVFCLGFTHPVDSSHCPHTGL